MAWTTLLAGKTEVSVEQFCQGFYEDGVFQAIVAHTDVHQMLCDLCYDELVKADSNFAQIKRETAREELTALQMVIFLLALGHRARDPQLLLRAFLFTKKYMEQTERAPAWESLGAYNQAISASLSDFITSTQDEKHGRFTCAFINQQKIDFFKQCKQDGVDLFCAAETCNQFFAEAAWQSEHTLKCLVGLCVYRLGWGSVHGETLKPTPDALFHLTVVLSGFYDGAQYAMKSVALK